MKNLRVLIIDDHFLIIEGYKSILLSYFGDRIIEIQSATNCQQAYNIIIADSKYFDFILLDITLPSYPEMNINSAQDLGKIIITIYPNAKLIILTAAIETFTLYSFIQNVRPHGIFLKSEFTIQEFTTIIERILNGNIIYSSTVKLMVDDLLSKKIYLDNFNRQIIILLSKGIKTKNLPNYLPLSLSSIDKRKVVIKDFFGLSDANDEDIIREARKAKLI